jgi:hypothetical protein
MKRGYGTLLPCVVTFPMAAISTAGSRLGCQQNFYDVAKMAGQSLRCAMLDGLGSSSI